MAEGRGTTDRDVQAVGEGGDRAGPPSGPKSSRMFTVSRRFVPAFGRRRVLDVGHPEAAASSNAMFIGLWISGSEATSWISNPGGTCSALRSSAAVRCGNVETSCTGAGAGFWAPAGPEMIAIAMTTITRAAGPGRGPVSIRYPVFFWITPAFA